MCACTDLKMPIRADMTPVCWPDGPALSPPGLVREKKSSATLTMTSEDMPRRMRSSCNAWSGGVHEDKDEFTRSPKPERERRHKRGSGVYFMKIAMAQSNPWSGDLRGNTSKICDVIRPD
jgi:hypothetical protein